MNEETIKAILEELRALSRSAKFCEFHPLSGSAKYCELRPTVYGKPIDIYFAELADRVEAAVLRMLKVLDGIVRLTNIMDYDAGPGYVEEITDMIRNSAKEALGMNSAYRVALERIVKLLNGLDENCGVDPVEIRDIARAALGDDCKEVTPCSP